MLARNTREALFFGRRRDNHADVDVKPASFGAFLHSERLPVCAYVRMCPGAAAFLTALTESSRAYCSAFDIFRPA